MGVIKLSPNNSPSGTDRTEVFLRTWTAAACDVLQKITGTAFTAADLSPQEVSREAATLREAGSWLRFACSGASTPPFQGEQSFGLGKSDALRCAQILMGEPFDVNQDVSAEYQDALDELFRQFAGAAALALKPCLGGEVNLALAGHDPGTWKPRLKRGYRVKSEGKLQFPLLILFDPDLAQSLVLGPPGKPAPQPESPAPLAAATPPAASKNSRNIELLLDVELPVALRFGKSEMSLSNILELSPGSVVELDQKIVEPVELLVGGKVVAQGEVVVLDGNYALRVTEVVNPLERLKSLQR